VTRCGAACSESEVRHRAACGDAATFGGCNGRNDKGREGRREATMLATLMENALMEVWCSRWKESGGTDCERASINFAMVAEARQRGGAWES